MPSENHNIPQHIYPRIKRLSVSATLAINEQCKLLEKQGREVFNMGLGQSPFPVPDTVVEELRIFAGEKDYLPVQGLPELQSAIAEHHQRLSGIQCTEKNVLIGPGSKELMFLLQLVFHGDLFIPTPTWVSYAPQARILGRPVHFLATSSQNNWQITPEQFEKLCSKGKHQNRLVILTYPSNPTGTTIPENHLKEIAEIARRHNVVLLSDEIYGKLHHTGNHQSIVPYYPEGTIYSGGLSKWCGAGGWRLGTFVFPKQLRWLQEAMGVVASETFTSTCAPIQYAAVRAFEGSTEIDNYLYDSRRILRATAGVLTKKLRDNGVLVNIPDGGFYLFPDFSNFRKKLKSRGIRNSSTMCEELLKDTGVATLPGVAFGQKPKELTMRIAYVNFDADVALRVASAYDTDLTENFVKQHCKKVVEAVDRICKWVGE